MSSRPKFKFREMIWLLLPVLLLRGVGWYFMRQPAKSDDGPWRVVVDEVKLVRVTPREVSQGYDTKVAIKAHMIGNPSVPPDHKHTSGMTTGRNWRVVSGKGGNEKVLFTSKNQNNMYSTISAGIGDRPTGTSALRLASIPLSLGTLTLKGEVQAINSYNVYPAGKPAYARQVQGALVPFSIVVRKAGQKITTPTVSKYRPFTVQRIEFAKSRQPSAAPGDISLAVVYQYEEPESKEIQRSFWSGDTYLQDEQGRKYSQFKKAGTPLPAPILASFLEPAGYEQKNSKIRRVIFDIPLSQVPQNSGAVTLRSSISLDDCWPLHFSVAVRDRNGKTINNPVLQTSRSR